MLVALTSDAAYSLLHAAGWSIDETAYTDTNSGRLVWLVYGHRGVQQVVAKAGSQSAAWNEAARLAAEIDVEAEQPLPQPQTMGG